MGKIPSINLNVSSNDDEIEKTVSADIASRRQKIDDIREEGVAKPSPYHSELRAKLRKKEILNFGQLPSFIVNEFDRLRENQGQTRRHFFYNLLRQAGANIPPDDQLDGRRL